MLCLWTAKGGAGCTVTATALAFLAAEVRPTLLVDLGGDVPSVLGLPEATPGIADWLTAERPPPDSLSRLEVAVSPNLDLLPAGDGGDLSQASGESGTTVDVDHVQRWEVLARLLAGDDRCVIVDIGPLAVCHQPLIEFAEQSLLVTRACYLALTAASRSRRPDGVVLVREPARTLRTSDVEAAIGVSVVATVPLDPAVARAVDAGVFVRRMPRSLKRLKPVVAADRGRAR